MLKLPEVLTEDEIRKLFSVMNNPRDLLIFKTIYYLGLRVSELNKISFDLKEQIARITQSKRNKDRLVPIPKPLLEMLKVMPFEFNLTKQRIWQLIKKYGRKAGFTKNIKVHTLRHSYATHIYEKTGNLKLVQSLLGHSSIQTTSIYCHLSTKDKKLMVDKVFDS